jgi:hypothetical protein
MSRVKPTGDPVGLGRMTLLGEQPELAQQRD